MKRIGPHNLDVISILVGSILGAGYIENRNYSFRVHFHMSSKNAEYLHWLHNFFYLRNYCSGLEPRFNKQIGKRNVVYFSFKFRTWSYTSFYFLYDLFYKDGVKCIKPTLLQYLNAQVLAIMFMDDGSRHGKTICISTNCFTYDDQVLLCNLLMLKFKLNFNIHRQKHQFRIYLVISDYFKFKSLVEPFIVKSMLYKLQ